MFHENQQIGFYTLIKKLGRGGFGEVWLAERRAKFVTTKVAVKLPLDEQIDHEAIKQEATLWEQASGHPNILPIIDADEYDGQIVIVSEYAPAGSLDEYLKTHGKMSVEKAVEMTIQILDGLEFLHSRNIIHRDLKPANILLQGKTPRLADFGISRALRTTVASQSQNISGTFAYMSPEALDGKRSVQTDVWSVGVNLYQFLTGTLPFPHKEPSVLFPAIIMREFAPLPDSIPQSLKSVVAKALAKLPENRYVSAGEMRVDLRRILRDEAGSDFIQADSRQKSSSEQIPLTGKKHSVFAKNSQYENETVVRSTLSFEQNEPYKNSNVWIYATITIVMIGISGIIAYILILTPNKELEQNSNEKNTYTENQDNSSIVLISHRNTNLGIDVNVASKVRTVKNINSENRIGETKNSSVLLSNASKLPRKTSPTNVLKVSRSSVNTSGSTEENNNLAVVYKIQDALKKQGFIDVTVTIDQASGLIALRGYTSKGRMYDAVVIAEEIARKPALIYLTEK